MELSYSKRIRLLYALCLAESNSEISSDLDEYDVLDAATYLSCYICFRAIRQSDRLPSEERFDNFDMLSVYQAFAMLIYTYLALPLPNESIEPAFDQAAVIITKTLFAELSENEWLEILESGSTKYHLIGDAEAEHWMNYRQDLDKALLAFIVAGTDENSPFDKDEVIPILSTLLSILCEAFGNA